MYHVLLVVQCIYGCSDEGREDGDGKEGSEITVLLYADDLVLCGESEEDLRGGVGTLC